MTRERSIPANTLSIARCAQPDVRAAHCVLVDNPISLSPNVVSPPNLAPQSIGRQFFFILRPLRCALLIALLGLAVGCPPPDLGNGDGDGQPIPVDSDGDGIDDDADVCPGTAENVSVGADGCPLDNLPADSDGDGVVDPDDLCAQTAPDAAVDAFGCAAAQRDGDGDGISDESDECPGTGAGTAVGSNGCAIVATPADSDGDGIADEDDDCPGTQPGSLANADGCAANQLDSDGDGITNNRDRCASTPAESQVDARGCAASQRDTDRDGVTDDMDTCAATAMAAVVDAHGCSDAQRDSDDDGVTDDMDACPATAKGTAITANGCPLLVGGGGTVVGGGGGGGGSECTTPEECDDDDACTVETCNNGFCGHNALPDCLPCNVPPICPVIDVVFIMDTSGSMADEAVALCSGIGQLVAELDALGVTLQPTGLGITQTLGPGPFGCLTNNVVTLLGGTVPGDSAACAFPGTLSAFESWGPAAAIVAERFAWTPGARRVIVPLSDEGPCNGNLPEGCNDPGDDRNSILNAIAVAGQHNVIISPVTGTGSTSCVQTLAAAAAMGTGGTAFQSTDPVADLADALYAMLLTTCDPGSCDDDNSCTLNDLCELGVCAGTEVPGCVPCKSDGQCGDNNACTDDICTDGICENIGNFDPSMFCCDPASGDNTPLQDGDPCTDDVCDAETGIVSHPAATQGTACDDGVICTVDDVCDGAGICAGTDIESVECTSDEDCEITLCNLQTGFCDCIEEPMLCLETVGPSTPGDMCFDLDEEITVRVNLGFGVHPVAGGQFSIGFDPAKFEFVSIEPGSFDDAASPFSIEVSEVVDSVLGEIVYQVATALGHPGAHGPTAMAVLKLKAISTCTEASICYLETAGSTFLSDPEGDLINHVPCCSGEFSIGDGAPKLICPSDVARNADAGRTTSTITWSPPQATASCGSAAPLQCSGTSTAGVPMNGMISTGGLLPIGLHQFTCSTLDDCGQTSTCSWNIQVNNTHAMTVDLQYSPTLFNGSLERCIEFEFYASCVEATTKVTQTVSFGPPYDFPGYARNVQLKIPANNYACVTARDVKHTLRSSFELEVVNGQYMASFLGDPILGGNWLVAGNLNGDHVIDILDFGILASQVATIQDIHTPCGYQGNHGDINGDGLVTSTDQGFITRHFLKADKNACCPGGGSVLASANTPGIESISLAQLQATGLGELAAGDLNGDGMLDQADIDLFDAGVTGRAGSSKQSAPRP